MQHIVVLSIDSGDPSVTDFHHGLLACETTANVFGSTIVTGMNRTGAIVGDGDVSYNGITPRLPADLQWQVQNGSVFRRERSKHHLPIA
jgi:hypothetical protein